MGGEQFVSYFNDGREMVHIDHTHFLEDIWKIDNTYFGARHLRRALTFLTVILIPFVGGWTVYDRYKNKKSIKLEAILKPTFKWRPAKRTLSFDKKRKDSAQNRLARFEDNPFQDFASGVSDFS